MKIEVIENIGSYLNRYIISGLQSYPDRKQNASDSDVPCISIENDNPDSSIPSTTGDGLIDVKSKYSVLDDIDMGTLLSFDSMNPNNKSSHLITIERLVRDTRISKQLKELYRYTCQLCGKQINGRNREFICEAHHIQPYNSAHLGDDTIKNLVVLCPNCHAQFDQLYYAINPETNEVHCFNHNDEYHLSKLKMAFNHTFGKEYLQYTWEQFYQAVTRDG